MAKDSNSLPVKQSSQLASGPNFSQENIYYALYSRKAYKFKMSTVCLYRKIFLKHVIKITNLCILLAEESLTATFHSHWLSSRSWWDCSTDLGPLPFSAEKLFFASFQSSINMIKNQNDSAHLSSTYTKNQNDKVVKFPWV